ncbi:Uncharacterised protein [Streptococcus pneumoniae]|nr:Uncharacterised protein [Streptococcus pneumoniae]
MTFFNRGSFVKYGARAALINKWRKLTKNTVKIIAEAGAPAAYIPANINWAEPA